MTQALVQRMVNAVVKHNDNQYRVLERENDTYWGTLTLKSGRVLLRIFDTDWGVGDIWWEERINPETDNVEEMVRKTISEYERLSGLSA